MLTTFLKEICTGADRVRREDSFLADLERFRKSPEINEPGEGTVLKELKPTFMSRGPIVMDEISEVGKGEIEALQMIEFDNGKHFLSSVRRLIITLRITLFSLTTECSPPPPSFEISYLSPRLAEETIHRYGASGRVVDSL